MTLWGRAPRGNRPIRARADRSAALDNYLVDLIEPSGPGLALAAIKDGVIVHAAGYGQANLQQTIPVKHDTIFHLASCGKQFTAIGILMLMAEGQLALDDPVSVYLPSLTGFDRGVTLRRLLNHTSGILDLYDESGTEELLARCATPTNVDLIRTYVDLGCPMAQRGRRPGDLFAYSNSGYDLLGSVIERVSGQSYHKFFQLRVFRPLGMSDTFSEPDFRIGDPRCAVGYILNNRGIPIEPDQTGFDGLVGSGSFYTTGPDMCRYEQALRANTLVEQNLQNEAFISGQTNDGNPTNCGFGWYLGEYDDMPVATHQGSWAGFYSYICCFLDYPLSVFVLSNNPTIELEAVVTVAIDAYLPSPIGWDA